MSQATTSTLQAQASGFLRFYKQQTQRCLTALPLMSMDELLKVTLEYVLASETTRTLSVQNALKPAVNADDIKKFQEARLEEDALKEELHCLYKQRVTPPPGEL